MIKKIRKSLIIASLSISTGLFSATRELLNGVEIVNTPVQSALPNITLEIGASKSTIPGASNRSGSSKRSQSPASGRANSSSGKREPKGYSSGDLADSVEQNAEKDSGEIEKNPKEIEKDEDDKAKAVGCMCMRKATK